VLVAISLAVSATVFALAGRWDRAVPRPPAEPSV